MIYVISDTFSKTLEHKAQQNAQSLNTIIDKQNQTHNS